MALKFQNPHKWGSYISADLGLAAISWAQHEAKRLVHFKKIGQPITEIKKWQDWWVYCPLRLRLQREDGEKNFELIDAIVKVKRKRNIVATQMVGTTGTVKEFINNCDYEIEMVIGLQHTDNGQVKDQYPKDEISELCELFDAEEAIECQSEFLSCFKITKIVITGYELTQMTESNYQVINATAISDEDYEIYSNEY